MLIKANLKITLQLTSYFKTVLIQLKILNNK